MRPVVTFPLVLVRHGISCANLAKRLPTPFSYPDSDPELTRVGATTAVKRGAELRAYLKAHAFHSPRVGASFKRRTQETARLMMRTDPLHVPFVTGSVPRKTRRQGDAPSVPRFLEWLAALHPLRQKPHPSPQPSPFILFTHGKFIDALVRHATRKPLPKTKRPHYSAFLFYVSLIPGMEPSVVYGGPLPYAKGPPVRINTRKQCAAPGDQCSVPVCNRKTRRQRSTIR
jgi:broad specificity phosphatase PhoE